LNFVTKRLPYFVNHFSCLKYDPRWLKAKALARSTLNEGWFPQIFVSLASSKTKMGKELSCVFVLTLQRKLDKNES
jgi:hypothetical protein